MESNFVDYVKIMCRSGKGGKGSMHLKHVKYNPNGGPDGGDGGKGGSIYLRGNHNYWTLLHLKYERHIFAEHGGNGGKDKCHGTDGKDVYIDVPCGTVVYNAETGKYVCDVTYDGQEILLLKGGRGGLGNFQFRTATNQAPRYAQPGEPMQEMTIILELKLLADVGLVGFPNAGKSTLVSSLSNARPKIANYPFTTMEPSLGIVGYRELRELLREKVSDSVSCGISSVTRCCSLWFREIPMISSASMRYCSMNSDSLILRCSTSTVYWQLRNVTCLTKSL